MVRTSDLWFALGGRYGPHLGKQLSSVSGQSWLRVGVRIWVGCTPVAYPTRQCLLARKIVQN